MMTQSAKRYEWYRRLRFAAPQALTGTRVVLGAVATIAALDGRVHLAAALITLGGVTDGLDGPVARRLGVSSAFGALFDCFTDYLCFIVAPWMLTRALVASDGSIVHEALIGLPLVTGAIRSARNGLIIVAQAQVVRELPGLATVFFAFLPVAAVFLDAPAIVGGRGLSALLTFFVVVFSLLMVASVPYPKLTRFRGMSTPVLVLLALMPFIGTQVLAGIMLVAGLMYVALAHLFVRREPRVTAGLPDAGHERVDREPELLP